MENKRLIPAPIDGKNVAIDWIEDIFDCGDYTSNGREFIVGFILNSVCCCYKVDNELTWQIISNFGEDAEKSYEKLISRLRKFDKDSLVVDYDLSMRKDLIVRQIFYFEDK